MQLYARGRDTRSGHLIIDELRIVTKHSPYFSLFNSSFFFFFNLLFKVVILKLQDYPSLSHIVILVPPSAGNKVIR